MKMYHKTGRTNAEAIARDGFRDADNQGFGPGVWVSNWPWSNGRHSKDDCVLEIEVDGISREVMFNDYEVIESGKPYREFLMPAQLLNGFARRVLTMDEAEELSEEQAWNEYPLGQPGAKWSELAREDEALSSGDFEN